MFTLPQKHYDAAVEARDALNDLIAEHDSAQEPVDNEIEITDEMISMNTWGVPDMHLKVSPAEFDKMRKYYDPRREPFNDTTWMTTAYGGKDVRPWKPEMVGNIEARRVPEQRYGALWVRIKKGYIVDESGQWYKRVSAEDGVTSFEALQYFRDFPLKEGQSLGWGCPREFKKAWKED